ncbi:HTTM domain-containing protein [Constantimarinum furrinae]|uniref:HTTM-like domain-containing protein n=1 Tax=Constantimarinum furrinae TaxID=2562285 RepID=A0A7G8PS74_9FLAO|nr:HTTM domain-containing protein [Constantimarinum furrinae]QNJ97190.1 hypothetical protein ALE3EI_0612 [Constantimarinum furrinae]
MFDRLGQFLFAPTNASIVSLYRIIFGLFMVYQMIYYYQLDYTYQFLTGPELLFPYQGLEFLSPLSESVMKLIHFGLLASSVLITVGFLYRYAMLFFCIGFTYFSFIDKTLYNNHLYLISLISFVLIFISADRKYSLKAYFSKQITTDLIPAWNQYILMFLIGLPYFFGGIAKLSPNWLNTDLVQIMVQESRTGGLTSIIPKDVLVWLIKYVGLVYDLLIVFLLLNKRTRSIGIVFILIFNFLNHSVLFGDIGLFPFLMICSTILFFDADKVGKFIDSIFTKKFHKKVVKRKEKRPKRPKMTKAERRIFQANQAKIRSEQQEESQPISISPWTGSRKAVVIGLSLFILFQITFPLRHFFITDNPEWTGRAVRFSWRMKMQTRELNTLEMTFSDRKTGEFGPVEVSSFLSTNQFIHLAEDPDNFIHLAKYLHKKIESSTGIIDPLIRADVQVSFNGLTNQPMFARDLDLVRVSEKEQFGESWISPLQWKKE